MTIFHRLFPRTSGVLGMLASWKALADDPVLLCACQDGEWWCDACEPAPAQSTWAAETPAKIRPAA